MFDFSDFRNVFPAGLQLPYDRSRQQEIESCRKTLDGALFIDRVLKALGISKAKAYPPKTENALRQLHHQICEASMSVPHKLSLFYYLVLDFDTSNEQKAISEGFTAASGIPNRYQIFMQGLWYMDQLDFSTALEYIAHPSLIPDFADDIIVALVRHAGNGDPSLAISYYHTVQPSLKSSVALGLLFGAIARTNATEALFFSRAYPEHTRQLLFQQFIRIMVGSAETSDPAVGAADLAFLPFDSTEEEWFQNFLTTGEGKSLRKGKETLLARNVARDQLYGVGRQKVTGQWAPIVKGIRTGLEGLAE